MSVTARAYDVDFYSDEFIRNPWPLYAAMRALRLCRLAARHGNYALTRHVAAALRDHATFISGKGDSDGTVSLCFHEWGAQ
jgi:hypothetical protein